MGLLFSLCFVYPHQALAQGDPFALESRQVAIDAGALLMLSVGDAMPRDLAEDMGAGQSLDLILPASHGATYLRFAHPKHLDRWTDVLIRGARVTACIRDGSGESVSVRTWDDGTMIRELRSKKVGTECGLTDGDGAEDVLVDHGHTSSVQAYGANCDVAERMGFRRRDGSQWRRHDKCR